MLERSRVGMRKVRRLVERVHAEAFHSIDVAAPHDQRADGTRLFGADHDQLQLAVFSEYAGTGLHPRELVHGAVRRVGKKIPPAGLALNGAEFLNNPY